GGFFVLSPRCLDLIEGDNSSWESSPIVRLAAMGQMMAFEHRGFWHAMDTLRDKTMLEELWASGKAPWKIWQGRVHHRRNFGEAKKSSSRAIAALRVHGSRSFSTGSVQR